jgi:hypothetical protein
MTQTIRCVSAGVVISLLVLSVGCQSAGPAPPAPPNGSQGKVLLHDDFDAYNPNWRQVRGQWAVADGVMAQVREDERERNTILFYEPLPVADAELETEVSMSVSPGVFNSGDPSVFRRIVGVGLVFRYQDENNFYMFRLAGEEGAVVGKMRNGQWEDMANPRAADFAGTLVQFRTPYRLKVRLQGRRIQCFIGERAVASLEDDTFSTGRVGLVTFRSQGNFSWIRVVDR